MFRPTLPRIALMALAITLPFPAVANTTEDRSESPALTEVAAKRKAFLASRTIAERKVPVSVARATGRELRAIGSSRDSP